MNWFPHSGVVSFWCVTSIIWSPVSFAADGGGDRQAMIVRIDELLAKRWRAESISPAGWSSDSEFVRRSHLDLTGVIPREADTRDFLKDGSTTK